MDRTTAATKARTTGTMTSVIKKSTTSIKAQKSRTTEITMPVMTAMAITRTEATTKATAKAIETIMDMDKAASTRSITVTATPATTVTARTAIVTAGGGGARLNY